MGFFEAIGAAIGGGVAGAFAVVTAIIIGAYTFGKGLIAGLSSAKMLGPNTIKAGEWGTWTVEYTTDPSKLPLGATEGDYEVEINWDPAITDPTSGPAFDDGKWKNVFSGSHSARIKWDADGPVKIEWKIVINGSVMGQGKFSVNVTN